MSTMGRGVIDKKAPPEISIGTELWGHSCHWARGRGDQTFANLETWAGRRGPNRAELGARKRVKAGGEREPGGVGSAPGRMQRPGL